MLLQDVAYALRGLWRSKAFATVAILCLGFGMGLNTTIFSIIDGVMLRPYPYTDPDRIVVLGERNQKTGGQAGLSYLDMRDWKDATTTFTEIAASSGRSLTVSDGIGEPDRYLGAAISWNLFPMLGTDPILGRGFTAQEDQPNAGGVVLLSHTVWTTRYHADRNILGRSILVNGTPHTVVGVMPPKFAFPQNQRLWVPLAPLATKDARDLRNLFAFGRLAPGVTMQQAALEVGAISDRLGREYSGTNEGWTARVRTLHEAFLPRDVTLVLTLMMAGVTLVLFIACSNVANLLLARAAGRRREFAVRVAIGAGRARIVRQLLTEGVVLSLASVPLGIVLALIGTRLIANAVPVDQVPYYVTWQVDARSLAYAIAVAVSTALIFGLFPALQVSRGDLHESLQEGGRGSTGGRSLLRSSLVIAQVSLALVALVGALLFVRTFVNLDTYDLRFDPKPLLTLRYYMAGDVYETVGAKARRTEDIVRRVEQLPGVQAAFASNLVPIDGGGGGGQVEIEGRAVDRSERTRITLAGVTPHLLKTLGAQIVRGRDFTDAEGWSRTPVAIINQTMAARGWSDSDPIEQRFRLTRADGSDEWYRVIGVMSDLQLFGLDPEEIQSVPSAFVPYAYQETLNTGLTIRVAGDPASLASAVRAQIRASDPNIPTALIRTLEEVRKVSFWQYGLFGWIFGTIGVVGLLLASIGVYGVLAYSVSQRTQEIGVRVALGADRLRVLRLVVDQGVRLAAVGIVVGIVLAAVGLPLAKSLLYNVSPFDPLSFGAVAVFLLLVALLASYVPARRAAKLDPIAALREG